MADLLLDVRYGLPGIGLDQRRFSSSVARPSWTIRLPENTPRARLRPVSPTAAAGRPRHDPGVRAPDEAAPMC